jgi:hypothetical protein
MQAKLRVIAGSAAGMLQTASRSRHSLSVLAEAMAGVKEL